MLLRSGLAPEEVLAEEEGALLGFRRDLAALERVHAAAAFARPGSVKDLHPAVTMDAVVAESEAADHAQVPETWPGARNPGSALRLPSVCCMSIPCPWLWARLVLVQGAQKS